MEVADLTEEEYDALDEKWTKNLPKPGPNGTGFFAQRKASLAAQSARLITIDSFTADYLLTKAIADGVIGSRNKIASISKKLLEHGFTQDEINHIHTPIGIAIKADTLPKLL
jgi:xanthine/CO dehydrogenase XdhC/CoxF family maturation factor